MSHQLFEYPIRLALWQCLPIKADSECEFIVGCVGKVRCRFALAYAKQKVNCKSQIDLNLKQIWNPSDCISIPCVFTMEMLHATVAATTTIYHLDWPIRVIRTYIHTYLPTLVVPLAQTSTFIICLCTDLHNTEKSFGCHMQWQRVLSPWEMCHPPSIVSNGFFG